MTCSAAPEQYDVYAGGVKVGYFRLRSGIATVARYLRPGDEFPDFDGELVLSDVNATDRFKGGYYSDAEQAEGLDAAALLIHQMWAHARTAPGPGGS